MCFWLCDTTCVTLKSDKTRLIGIHCSTMCWETAGVQFCGPPCISDSGRDYQGKPACLWTWSDSVCIHSTEAVDSLKSHRILSRSTQAAIYSTAAVLLTPLQRTCLANKHHPADHNEDGSLRLKPYTFGKLTIHGRWKPVHVTATRVVPLYACREWICKKFCCKKQLFIF